MDPATCHRKILQSPPELLASRVQKVPGTRKMKPCPSCAQPFMNFPYSRRCGTTTRSPTMRVTITSSGQDAAPRLQVYSAQPTWLTIAIEPFRGNMNSELWRQTKAICHPLGTSLYHQAAHSPFNKPSPPSG